MEWLVKANDLASDILKLVKDKDVRDDNKTQIKLTSIVLAYVITCVVGKVSKEATVKLVERTYDFIKSQEEVFKNEFTN